MADKSSGVRTVPAVVTEMRDAIIALAGDRGWFDNRKRWLETAAQHAGISYRAAKALFYCESKDPKSSVVDRVREAVRVQKAAPPLVHQQQHQEAQARVEYADVSNQLAALNAELAELRSLLANGIGPAPSVAGGESGEQGLQPDGHRAEDRSLDQE